MKVYIFGPIHLNGESYLPLYKHLVNLYKNYFDEVIGTYPDFWDSKESPNDFYKRTYKTITTADLFIAEVSTPSTGVGMELQMGQERNIPCIGICKQGQEPSAMVRGLPNLKQIIYYSSLEDLTNKLINVLNNK